MTKLLQYILGQSHIIWKVHGFGKTREFHVSVFVLFEVGIFKYSPVLFCLESLGQAK